MLVMYELECGLCLVKNISIILQIQLMCLLPFLQRSGEQDLVLGELVIVIEVKDILFSLKFHYYVKEITDLGTLMAVIC
jgi:hypothetical protein